MISKRLLTTTLAALFATVTFNVANAQEAATVAPANAERGSIRFETCRGCHAIKGWTNVYPTYSVPMLGGQSADYITSALNAYRSGERQHPTMQAMARSLSPQDVVDIAAYLNTIK